jgi:hypothetical protein
MAGQFGPFCGSSDAASATPASYPPSAPDVEPELELAPELELDAKPELLPMAAPELPPERVPEPEPPLTPDPDPLLVLAPLEPEDDCEVASPDPPSVTKVPSSPQPAMHAVKRVSGAHRRFAYMPSLSQNRR